MLRDPSLIGRWCLNYGCLRPDQIANKIMPARTDGPIPTRKQLQATGTLSLTNYTRLSVLRLKIDDLLQISISVLIYVPEQLMFK